MREFKTPKGTTLPLMDIKGKPYLSVQHRVMWFREDHPDYSIETEFVGTTQTAAFAKATIRDASGRILATGHKYEDQKGFEDFREKSESSAIGRALGFLGYGTQFALDLEEGERLADAPTNETEKKTNFTQNIHLKDGCSVPAKTSEPRATQFQSSKLGDYVVTFGKFKDRTIKDIAESESPQKISSYIQWLENDAKVKKKPITQAAKDMIEAFDAFVGEKEIEESMPQETFEEKMDRLKNQHPGVPGKPMPLPYKDDNGPMWDPDESWPEDVK